MSVKIRLKRMGSKKRPFYRMVVADERAPRDGRYIEELGYYEQIEDAMFRDYIAEMSKFEIFQKVEFTDDEQKFLQQESKRVIEQILKKNNKI